MTLVTSQYAQQGDLGITQPILLKVRGMYKFCHDLVIDVGGLDWFTPGASHTSRFSQ